MRRTDQLSKEERLARIRSGEREWFGPLVRKYERELYGYLRRYVGDADLAVPGACRVKRR